MSAKCGLEYPSLDADELKLLLGRAFDRAWGHCRAGRPPISPAAVRPAPANHLVQLDAVTDEGELAARGVLHLYSIKPEDPGDLSA